MQWYGIGVCGGGARPLGNLWRVLISVPPLACCPCVLTQILTYEHVSLHVPCVTLLLIHQLRSNGNIFQRRPHISHFPIGINKVTNIKIFTILRNFQAFTLSGASVVCTPTVRASAMPELNADGQS